MANIDNSNGDSLIHSVFCRNIGRCLSRTTHLVISYSNLRNSVRVVGDVRFISRGSVKGDSHSGPIACVKTCSRVHGLCNRRPLTGRVNCSTTCFSFGGRNKQYRRYGKRNEVAIRVRFVTSVALRYRAYRNGHFGRSILSIRCRNTDVCSVLRVAIGRTVRFFKRCPKSRRGGVIGGLGPLRSIKLKCVGLKRASSALSNNRGRHIGLTCCLNRRGRRPALFIFSRPAANLRFRSVGALLGTFGTLVSGNRAIIVVRRGVSIVGYTSCLMSLNPRNKGTKKGLIYAKAPRRITVYRTSCAKGCLGSGL